MCGITGIIDFRGKIDSNVLENMTKTLMHRGPNNQSSTIVTSENNLFSVGLGHARLSIIDLTEEANQPMRYGNYHLVFNGEIYNYRMIKEELCSKGHNFFSQSDTEVVLHAYEEWGIECVNRFIGMFAFVLYDQKTEKVFFFRDRVGVKPLYYYMKDGLILFGSELKAFHKHPLFHKEIDEKVLYSYFNFGYIPSPQTIFKYTYKLDPAEFVSIDLTSKDILKKKYWSVDDYYKMPKLRISYDEAKEELHEILRSAFNYRMVADVPVGVFLSGGYDSTAVAAIIQRSVNDKLKTFTIGVANNRLNEAHYAKNTAAFLGTDHYEYYCTTKEAQAIIPMLPFYYDEPFGDSSAIPTTLVSKLAKEHVTVALSADGSDEIFGGYVSHISLIKRLIQLNRVPSFLKPYAKQALSFFARAVPSSKIDLKHKLKGASLALHSNPFKQSTEVFKNMVSLPDAYMEKLFTRHFNSYRTNYEINFEGFSNEIDLALAVDYQMYLPNDILTKVDRATMSVSLEGRDPFLDQRIVEFVARLPVQFKIALGGGKRILKDIVHDYIPKEMMDRPKAGFGVPIYDWLRADLSYLVDEYLNEQAIKEHGLFQPKFVNEQVRLLKANKLYYKTHIWKLLMFQMWYAKWMR